jgi:hypothetical protein
MSSVCPNTSFTELNRLAKLFNSSSRETPTEPSVNRISTERRTSTVSEGVFQRTDSVIQQHLVLQYPVVETPVDTDFPATPSSPKPTPKPTPKRLENTSRPPSPYPVPEELFVRTLSPVPEELVVGTPRKEWPDMIARYPIPPRRPSSIVLCEKAGKDLPMYQIEPIPDPIPKKLKNGWRPLSSPFFAFGLPD